jgi:hypothetical protein
MYGFRLFFGDVYSRWVNLTIVRKREACSLLELWDVRCKDALLEEGNGSTSTALGGNREG